MKYLLLIALLPFSAQADDFDKYLREGDTVEFTKDIVFTNTSKYDSSYVYVQGREYGSNPRNRCSLYVSVPANSKSTLRAGRKMKITASLQTISLESGLTISCERKYSGLDWETEFAHVMTPAEISASLPMLRFERLPPPSPDNRDL